MVQFFTSEQGRLVGVMKGLRRGRNPVQVQPFSFGSLSCIGRGGLATVTQFDVGGRFELSGDALSAGFYVLELITRTLAEGQSEPRIFAAAQNVLGSLEQGARLAPCLRVFEEELLTALGYGVDYLHEAGGGAAIEPQTWYAYEPESGFLVAPAGSASIPGWVLLAINRREFNDPVVLRTARQLNSEALLPLLGTKPLVSRSLLSSAQQRDFPHV